MAPQASSAFSAGRLTARPACSANTKGSVSARSANRGRPVGLPPRQPEAGSPVRPGDEGLRRRRPDGGLGSAHELVPAGPVGAREQPDGRGLSRRRLDQRPLHRDGLRAIGRRRPRLRHLLRRPSAGARGDGPGAAHPRDGDRGPGEPLPRSGRGAPHRAVRPQALDRAEAPRGRPAGDAAPAEGGPPRRPRRQGLADARRLHRQRRQGPQARGDRDGRRPAADRRRPALRRRVLDRRPVRLRRPGAIREGDRGAPQDARGARARRGRVQLRPAPHRLHLRGRRRLRAPRRQPPGEVVRGDRRAASTRPTGSPRGSIR